MIILFFLGVLIVLSESSLFDNITIIYLKFNYYEYKEYNYELTVPEGEEFGIKYEIRVIPTYWFLNNIEILNDQDIKYLRTYTTPYPQGFYGASTWEYLFFKAERKTNQTKIFHFSYGEELNSGNRVLTTAFVKINVCDKQYKDQCMNNSTHKCICDDLNQNCESKILCNQMQVASENSCHLAAVPSPSTEKCVYIKSGEYPSVQERCIVKKICMDNLSFKDCNSATTLNPQAMKCLYNNISKICEKKELCEIETSPNKTVCANILTSNQAKTKCFYDQNKNLCAIKDICSEIEFPSKEICENAITSNENLKCIFEENEKKCVELYLCSENIINPEINCEKATTLNVKSKCVYDEKENKCKEEDKTCSDIKDGATEEICINAKISENKKKCILDNDKKGCVEVEKDESEELYFENSGNKLIYSFLNLAYLYLFLEY